MIVSESDSRPGNSDAAGLSRSAGPGELLRLAVPVSRFRRESDSDWDFTARIAVAGSRVQCRLFFVTAKN